MQKISEEQKDTPMNGVQSVERALDLMECLGRASGWLGISELSSATGQPVGTIHRLLKTLVAREYVVRDSRTRRYAIGPAFRMMVGVGMQGPDWAKIGTPILRELAYLSGETANLAVIDRDRAVYVAQAQPARMVRMFTEIGNRVHLHSTGCGKVLLAHQPDSVIASIIAETGLPAYTETTFTDPGLFKQELETIRQQGYAIDNGEQEDGVRCIAMPVYDKQGKTVAAVSVSGPSSRIDTRRTPLTLPHLRRASAALSSALAAAQEEGDVA